MVLIQDCERTAKKTENRLIVKLLLNNDLKIRMQIFEYLTHHRVVLKAVVLKAGDELSKCVQTSVKAAFKQLSGAEVIKTTTWICGCVGSVWGGSRADIQRTHYEIHAKRGLETMDAFGILSDFKGTLVHDPWIPYF